MEHTSFFSDRSDSNDDEPSLHTPNGQSRIETNIELKLLTHPEQQNKFVERRTLNEEW